jgi:MFS family permease
MLKDKTFWGLNLSVFLIMVGVGMIVALLPQRIIDLDGDGRNAGYLASTFAIAYIMLQMPVGTMADKFGFKLFLVLGYLSCAIAGLCFYFSASLSAIFLSRIVQGAGEAPIWALAPALLSVKYPHNKGAVMGAYNSVLHIGLTAGPVLGVYLAKMWHTNNLFLIYALACLAGAVLIYLLVEDVHPKCKLATPFSFSKILIVLRQSKALLALLGITLYGAGYGIFLTSIPIYLRQEKGFSSWYIGVFFSLFYVAISLSQIVAGKLSDKFGPGIFMVLGLLIPSLNLVCIHYLSFIGVLTMLTMASFGLGIFYLSSMIFLNETVGEELKGTISGAYYLFWGIGMFFGPPMLSTLSNHVGFSVSLIAYALFLLAVSASIAIKLKSFTS